MGPPSPGGTAAGARAWWGSFVLAQPVLGADLVLNQLDGWESAVLGFALWTGAGPGLLFSRAFTSHEYLKEALLKLLGCRLEIRLCR